MIGDTDVEEIAPALSPVEAVAPEKHRRTQAEKWDALTLRERADALVRMCQLRMLMEDPAAVLAMVMGREDEHDTRFSALTFDTQEKVISYLRKNFEDKA